MSSIKEDTSRADLSGFSSSKQSGSKLSYDESNNLSGFSSFIQSSQGGGRGRDNNNISLGEDGGSSIGAVSAFF